MLELRCLSAGYSSKLVISDISFKADKGSFWGIIGPNGAGKTTLFRAISRIIKPFSGDIFFDGKNVLEIERVQLAKTVATMLQAYDFPFSYTVEEFVMMGRYPHQKRFEKPTKNDHDIVQKNLEFADLLPLKNQKLNELSGGERQRAMLAQALAQKPKLLLLDEPTAYLDIGHQITMLDLIKKLNKTEGLTVVMILHDLNLASEYCENLLLLNNGRTHISGTPRDVLTYENIETVYKTVAIVKDNPISRKPYIFAVPHEYRNTNKEC
jgi:iron complex transport system ATP-binding protein